METLESLGLCYLLLLKVLLVSFWFLTLQGLCRFSLFAVTAWHAHLLKVVSSFEEARAFRLSGLASALSLLCFFVEPASELVQVAANSAVEEFNPLSKYLMN